MKSKLYIVPTPIGNLQDMTFRSVEVLKMVDTILTEDTRVTGKLLKHFQISAKTEAYHQHNEHQKTAVIINRILSGETIAIVSDAGTPAISDPGFLLVRECIKNGIETECLPGATALIPALVISGMPCDTFYFEGFLPHKKGRNKRLSELKELDKTIILYESPHRLFRTLSQMSEIFPGNMQIVICRELTKVHEEVIRDTLDSVKSHFENNAVKGEIVIVFNPGILL